MTTSDARANEAFVWVWLPNAADPVVCGRLSRQGDRYLFNYARSYLARPNAISLYEPELPLALGWLPLLPGLNMPGCIRDASPDAWGRRVIERQLMGRGRQGRAEGLDELTYLLQSSSDRFGAIDFQPSPDRYEERVQGEATLDDLYDRMRRIDRGEATSPALDRELWQGTSMGGARPKVLLDSEDRKYIAKFPSVGDRYPVIKTEFVATRLAATCGLDVATVSLTQADGEDALLIERFDRRRGDDGAWHRRAAVSALTLLGLDESAASLASYEKLAEIIRHRFHDSRATLKELFGRISFNILCSNTDDHARNHAAFWDGSMLSLTPAYDISPQPRLTGERAQAMRINGGQRLSRLDLLLDTAAHYLLSEAQALTLVHGQIAAIGDHWDAVCEEAALTSAEREHLALQVFLPPYTFEELAAPRAAVLTPLAEKTRQKLTT